MNKENVKNAPPLLGRYRLLKEKRRSTVYRSFLAYDLKLKRGVIAKLVPVENFQKKHLPVLWQYLERVFHDEENISRVVELDFQKGNLLVVEEYLEGKYFKSQIFQDAHDYERFEILLYRAIDLIRRMHSNRIAHGFLDFRNIKVTLNDGVFLEDYPLLHWLESNRLLPSGSTVDAKLKPEIRDIRQLGLIFFNVYRTQLVPEFHAFPDKYSRAELYDFFRKTEFSHFSDIERVMAGLLLAGEPPKGYTSIEEAYKQINDIIGQKPPPVSIREKTSPLKKSEPKKTVSQVTKIVPQGATPQDLAKQLGRPARMPAEVITTTKETEYEKKPDIRTRKQLIHEGSIFKGIAWGITLLCLATLCVSGLVVTREFLAKSIPEITMPVLVGSSFEEAEKAAGKLNLKLKISGEEYSEELPEGIIIEHQPPAGARTKSGRTVYAVVSKGLAVVSVPNLMNLSESAAEDSIAGAQLYIGKKEFVANEDVPLGIVIDQNPPANVKVAVGDQIDLVISAGLLKSRLPMPNLEGMTLLEALNVLDQKRLIPRRITRSYSPYFERDSVKYQKPVAGEEVIYGMMVDLEVVIPSRLAPSEEFQIEISITLPSFDGRKRVRVVDRNQRFTREVHNQLHGSSERIRLYAPGVGRTQLTVYLGDDLIKEEIF